MLKYFAPTLLLSYFLVPASVWAAAPAGAVKFVILKPSDSTVGTPVTVTVEARKQNNQVDTAYQNDVTLVTSGSATGGGLVNIVNGIGTRAINDLVAETITLSLSDTQATGLDVSSTREVEFEPAEPAEPGEWNQQKFVFRDDDGNEATASGFGAENVNQNTNIINVAPGTNFRLRFAVKLTDADGSIAPRLEFKEGTNCTTGSWTVITSVSSVFNLQLSPNFIDSSTTTQQLVGGPNFIAGQILESTNSAMALSMLKNQSTEYEWSLKAWDNIPLGTTNSFRITNNGTALTSYGQCPSLSIQQPPPPSNDGRGAAVRPTTVSFSGKAFPGAKVFVVNRDPRYDQTVSQDLVTAEDGAFQITFDSLFQSQNSFGLVIKDKEGRTAQTKLFNIDTLANTFVVKDVSIPPTVGFTSPSVTRGKTTTITGYAAPQSRVLLELDDTIKTEVETEADGSYKKEINTGPLEFGRHRVRAKQIFHEGKEASDFSPVKILAVSRLILPRADLSDDGKVDIKDWSMFLSSWVSPHLARKEIIDFNEDGKVDISDFSIFVRTIRKV